jgi:hypothetical protein
VGKNYHPLTKKNSRTISVETGISPDYKFYSKTICKMGRRKKATNSNSEPTSS